MAEHDDPARELTSIGAVATLPKLTDDAAEFESDDAEGAESSGLDSDADDKTPVEASRKGSAVRRLVVVGGLVVAIALCALIGWLGFRAHQLKVAADHQKEIVQVARQGALNLTTIDWQHADADVQRILDSATGEFYDDFSKRSAPFVKVVKEAKSTSVGSITEAGLESESSDTSSVLVAVAVKTSNAGVQEQEPREWRMRISVQKVNDGMKVSNVEFVP